MTMNLDEAQKKFLDFTCDRCGHIKEYFCLIIYADRKVVSCRECYKGLPKDVRTTLDYFIPNWFRLTDRGREVVKRMTN